MLYVAIILFVLITTGLAVLTFENFQSNVQLSLFAWSTPALPIGLLLLFAFLLGALLLYIVAVASAWQDRSELRRLQREVTELKQAAMSASKVAMAPNVANVSTGPLPR